MFPKVKWLQKANHMARPLLRIFLFQLPRAENYGEQRMGHLLVSERVTYLIHVRLTLCRDSISFVVHKIKIYTYTSLFL